MMGIETMKNVSPKTVDYCYLDGKTVVKITFAATDTTMEDCLEHYLRGL